MIGIIIVIALSIATYFAILADARGKKYFFTPAPPKGFFMILLRMEQKDRVVDGDNPDSLSKTLGVVLMSLLPNLFKPYVFDNKRPVLKIHAGDDGGGHGHNDGHTAEAHSDGTGIVLLHTKDTFIPYRNFVALNPRNIEMHGPNNHEGGHGSTELSEHGIVFAKFVFIAQLKVIKGQEIEYVTLAESGSSAINNSIAEIYSALKKYTRNRSFHELIADDTDTDTGNLITTLRSAEKEIRTNGHVELVSITMTDVGPEENEKMIEALQKSEIARLEADAAVLTAQGEERASLHKLAAGRNQNQIIIELKRDLGDANFQFHTVSNGNLTTITDKILSSINGN